MGVEADLLAMGFDLPRIQLAIAACGENLEPALQYLVEHEPGDRSTVETELLAMGFEEDRVKRAIRSCGEHLEPALQWLVEGGGDEDGVKVPPAKVQRRSQPPPPAPAHQPARAMPAMHAAAPVPPARVAPMPAPVPPPPMPRPSAPKAAGAGSSSSASSSASADVMQRSLKRLMKEYTELHALEQQPGGCRRLHAFEASPVDDSDLYIWDLRLYDFESDQPIAADLAERGLECVTLRIIFPSDYPNNPPFVHVLRPRLKEGTGYVLNGGGICMELLTPSEWSPATHINALVMSIRAMLVVGNARLKSTVKGTKEHDYSFNDAHKDFQHIVKVHKAHGWTSHPMFKNA